jgi:methylthioribose-1-phosphate isomerase
MTLKSIRYESGKLEILDQLSLPAHSQYIEVKGVEDGWRAIHKMHVSGIYSFQITYFIFDTLVRRVVFIISLTNIPLLW